MTYDEFIDMCILCGCDYTGSIRNVGPIKAYQFIKKYGNIETVVKYIEVYNENSKIKNPNKKILYKIPNNFDYQTARSLFKSNIDDEYLEICKKNIKIIKARKNELVDFMTDKIHPKVMKDIEKNITKHYLILEKELRNNLKEMKITNYFKCTEIT